VGLDVAIDELYASGWSGLDTSRCTHHADGRWYPSQSRVIEEFARAGYTLAVRHVQLFDCYRAEWKDAQGRPIGAVVGQTADEAAVYALAQLRRTGAAATDSR